LLLLSVTPVLLVSACTPETLKVQCPSLRKYSKQYQNLTAEELDALKEEKPHLRQMIDDYLSLREACKAVSE
jgi:hypothetical protein